MKDKLIPVTLLTGYLGAGKTTLLNYVLNNQKGYKVAVIVNDIGEVNIDADLIAKGAGIVEQDKDSVVPLENGCICCSLKTDLINQIISLCDTGRFDYILIEASGLCEPQSIAQSIEALSGGASDDEYADENAQDADSDGENSTDSDEQLGDENSAQYEDENGNPLPAVCKLDNIVTVVDAARLVTEFAGGNSLLNTNLDDQDIEALLIQQIEFCNTILINKTDLVTPEQLDEVRAVVKTLQPVAKIIETQKGVTDLCNILGTNSFNFKKVYATAGWLKKMEAYDAALGPNGEIPDEHEHNHGHEHHEHEHEDCGHTHNHENCGHGEHEHNHEDCGHEHEHEHENCGHGEHEHNHEDCEHGEHHHNHENCEHEHHNHEHGENCTCGCHGHHHGEGHNHAEAFGISTFVYYSRRPFDRMKLEEFASHWPGTVIRAKGLVWFADSNDEAYILEQAGQQIDASYAGQWIATAPKDQIAQALKHDAELKKNWDEKLGDRMTKMVFIGKKMKQEKIISDLNSCTVAPIGIK